MLRLSAGQAECLWDEALPVEVRELPRDLAALDLLLSDPGLLGPIAERFRLEVSESSRAVLTDGRPTIAMETFIRLMVLKTRYRWGYRTLVAEVSDSIHLRRFCRISLSERVPDESTVRKLTRRLGSETVSELTRTLIASATREKRFRARAVRVDSTVIEADVKYPTDAGLAATGQGAGAGGSQAGAADRREQAAGAGSLASDGPPAAGDHAHDPSALRGGEGRGAQAHSTDRRAVAALGARGQTAGEARALQGAWPGREGQAESGGQTRAPRIVARRSPRRSRSG